MKTYEEMAQSVLHRMAAYETARRQRRARIVKTAAAAVPVCALAAAGIGLWHGSAGTQTPLVNTFAESSITAELTAPDSAAESTVPAVPRKVISSYPETVESSYAVPEAGKWGFTSSLYQAMEEYGDRAEYLLKCDVFANPKQAEHAPVFDSERLTAEAERLCALGYTAAVESEPIEGTTYNYLTLQMTYAQLQNFDARADYSYFFRLAGPDETGFAE